MTDAPMTPLTMSAEKEHSLRAESGKTVMGLWCFAEIDALRSALAAMCNAYPAALALAEASRALFHESNTLEGMRGQRDPLTVARYTEALAAFLAHRTETEARNG